MTTMSNKRDETKHPCFSKVRYRTELDAAIALFKISTKDRRPGRDEQRSYACGNHWHLTSKPKRKTKEEKK